MERAAATLFVPDHVLTVPRARLGDFYLLFARFEFALKASGYAKAGKWGAEVDWDRAAQEFEAKVLSNPSDVVRAAAAYLQTHPPKQQWLSKGRLEWRDRPAPPRFSRARSVLFYLQGARNNLMHGAKFLPSEASDPDRDMKLLVAAESLIAAFLHHAPKLAQAFDSEVGA